jgi:hypothetical protein
MNANDATLTRLAAAQTGSRVTDAAPNAPASGFDLVLEVAAGSALGGSGTPCNLTISAIDLTAVSQRWPAQAFRQAFDPASGWKLSGTGPDYEYSQVFGYTGLGGPGGPLACQLVTICRSMAGLTRRVRDEALLAVWASGGPRATTAVRDAERREVASAIAWQASLWRADLIVLARRPWLAVSGPVMGCASDQVKRQANCPVLAVHPRWNDPGRGSRQLPFKQSPCPRWTNSRPSADASDPARHHCRPARSPVCRQAVSREVFTCLESIRKGSARFLIPRMAGLRIAA